MEEGQVTTEGKTRHLPTPFFVIATQNPSEQAGTYPLPESQLDRFMMRISLGYPSKTSEKQLLMGTSRQTLLKTINATLNADTLKKIQSLVDKVKCAESLIDYIYRLVEFTRVQPGLNHGLSPRAALTLLRAAKSWALIDGRDHIIPDDIQAVFPSVAEHRISGGQHHTDNPVSQNILKSVDIF